MGGRGTRWNFVGVAFAVALTASFAGTYAACMIASDGWMDYTIDQAYHPSYPQMAADSMGRNHILYNGMDEDGTFGYSYVAVGNGRDWSSTLIPLGSMLLAPSICFDAEDAMHIAKVSEDALGYNDVRYVTDSGGSWEYLQYEPDVDALFARIAIDSEGDPRILAATRPLESPDQVLSLSPAEEDWNVSTAYSLGTGWRVSSMSSLAADPEERLHALVFRSNQYDSQRALDHLVFDDGVWTVTDGPDLGDADCVFSPQSVAVDEDGDLHVTFNMRLDGTAAAAYATEHDGIWTVETLRETGSETLLPTIALDSSGTPYVAFMFGLDSDNTGTAYAVRVDGGWRTTALDDRTAPFSGSCSIVLDDEDGIHICAGLPHAAGSSFDVVYMTDTEPGLLTEEWLKLSAAVTGLVAILACAPATAALYLWDKRKTRIDELASVGLHDHSMK